MRQLLWQSKEIRARHLESKMLFLRRKQFLINYSLIFICIAIKSAIKLIILVHVIKSTLKTPKTERAKKIKQKEQW